MVSYSDIMKLMNKYNDLKDKLESKDTPYDKNDTDVQEFYKVVQVLLSIQKEIDGEGCHGGCCGHHH
jgi:hypothetical protein